MRFHTRVSTKYRPSKKPGKFLGLITVVMLSLTAVVYAHHGWAEFNQNKEVTLTGTVENPSFEYPHTTMNLTTEEGVSWDIIMAPPRRLIRMGVSEDNLVEGITVTIKGHPHRENDMMMRIFKINIDDETLNIR